MQVKSFTYERNWTGKYYRQRLLPSMQTMDKHIATMLGDGWEIISQNSHSGNSRGLQPFAKRELSENGCVLIVTLIVGMRDLVQADAPQFVILNRFGSRPQQLELHVTSADRASWKYFSGNDSDFVSDSVRSMKYAVYARLSDRLTGTKVGTKRLVCRCCHYRPTVSRQGPTFTPEGTVKRFVSSSFGCTGAPESLNLPFVLSLRTKLLAG